MKRVGLIDNLSHIDTFITKYAEATAAQVMAATGGNTGNLAFVAGTRALLANPIKRIGWDWAPEAVRQHCDHIVVACANQVGSHVDLGDWLERLEKFGLPTTLVGLGAQAEFADQPPTPPSGTLDLLRYIDGQARNSISIAVRGNFTCHVLGSFGVRSLPLGCPSLMLSRCRDLGQKILLRQEDSGAVRKVAVAAGNPWHTRSAPLERTLSEIVDRLRGDYVLQHPEPMLALAYGEPVSVATLECFVWAFGGRFDFSSLRAWFRRNATAFVDVGNWIRHLKRFDAVIGPRYHGVALGVQAGVSGLVVTIDARTQELCEGSGLKAIDIADALPMGAEELVEAARWTQSDAERLDSSRAACARGYVQFLTQNELVPSAHLLSLAA